MDIVGLIWKISYMAHMITNSAFFGSSVLMLLACEYTCESKVLSIYKKFSSIFLIVSFLSGIGLLSILSMGGMDDLTTNNVGISILLMISGFSILVFIFIFLLLYKGDSLKTKKILIQVMVLIYFLVYLSRVYLVH